MLKELLFPRRCVVCGERLLRTEEHLCLSCFLKMPRTRLHRIPDNGIERLLRQHVDVERATAFFYYSKGSPYKELLYHLKYRGQREIGIAVGKLMAGELQADGFFRGIDLLLPVPLHPKRQRERGYNQSEWIARGISQVTAIPIEAGALVRSKQTQSQTLRSLVARQENMAGSFELQNPAAVVGKHVLLIDDVLTTGATMLACAMLLQEVPGLKLSVFTMARAK